jgi:hypothetical protein
MIPTLNFIHSGALKLAIERSRDLREFFAPTIFPLIVMARVAVARDSSSHGQFIYITVHDASLEQDHVGDSAEREPAIDLSPKFDRLTQRRPSCFSAWIYREGAPLARFISLSG